MLPLESTATPMGAAKPALVPSPLEKSVLVPLTPPASVETTARSPFHTTINIAIIASPNHQHHQQHQKSFTIEGSVAIMFEIIATFTLTSRAWFSEEKKDGIKKDTRDGEE
jgi:hypothetical protein